MWVSLFLRDMGEKSTLVDFFPQSVENSYFQCPCAERQREQDRAAEAEKRAEQLKKKLQEKSEMEKEKERRENLIEKRKKSFYQKLKKADEEAMRSRKPSRIPEHKKDLAKFDRYSV